MNEYKITVTAASGVEGIVKNELKKLGFPDCRAIDGGITLDGTATDVARLNMFLRCADRVYISLGTFHAETFNELFDGVAALPLGDIIPFNAKIIVNGKCRRSKLFSVSDCQSIVKKAILTSMGRKYNRSVFPESGETYRAEFVISSDEATIYLNTSGEGLHKRGWRDLVWEAPIKETLACAMLELSDFSAESPFCDPFCGSGAIIIEAARKALGIAPGKDRSFDYQKWDFFDETAYKLAYEEAEDNENRNATLHFYGSDINPKAISLAVRHATRAKVKDKIHLQTMDVSDFRCAKKDGCIVTNPPYGERLLTKKETAEVYAALGKTWKALHNWSLFAITSAPNFEKNLGKKCDKNRKLYNSGLECRLYEYFKERNR